MYKFKNKVVLITGASSGIGRATATEFAKHGSYLVITGRDTERLKETEEQCRQLGAIDVLPIFTDFANITNVDLVVEETIKKFQKIDILVNNAGILLKGGLEDLNMVEFDSIFAINVKSMIRLTQLAIPHLVRSKGNVVNVSGICAFRQYPNLLLYNMTKAAVDQFTKTVALEYAPKGVRVNSVNPASIRTNVRRTRFSDQKEVDQYYEDVAPIHPLGRVGTVEEVANAILFLASDVSAWTTGHCLVLDGGRTLNSK